MKQTPRSYFVSFVWFPDVTSAAQARSKRGSNAADTSPMVILPFQPIIFRPIHLA